MGVGHYEERIRRLRGALKEIKNGLVPLTTMSLARQALDSDEKLAEQFRREAGED